MSSSIKTVVIGTSLTEASDVIVGTGVEVARAAGATIHLVHSYELPVAYGAILYAMAPPLPSPLDEKQLVRDLRARLDAQVQRLGALVVPRLFGHVMSGPAHRALLDQARRVKADLVVLGAADTLLGRVLGTTASRVLRGAECPVLLLRSRIPVPPERVLLPVDLSPISVDVVRRGLAILEQLGAVRGRVAVEAFYSVPPVGYEGFLPRFDPGDLTAAGAAELDELLARNVLGLGWNLARRSDFGPARERILSRIEGFRPNLVILGTHGASGFERFLLGSVAESVLRTAAVSVLVVPPLAARSAAEGIAPAGKTFTVPEATVAAVASLV